MPIESTPIAMALSLLTGGLLYVFCGVRFRRWATDDRPGIPRFSPSVETILLWMVYSGVVAIGIIVFRQALRHL
jgi:hypothetical protein